MTMAEGADTVSGEVRAYLGALGMHPTDPRLTAVLDLPGPTTDTNEHREADGNVVFHLAEPDWESETDDRFRIDGDWLQLHYDDDRIQVVIAAIGERD